MIVISATFTLAGNALDHVIASAMSSGGMLASWLRNSARGARVLIEHPVSELSGGEPGFDVPHAHATRRSSTPHTERVHPPAQRLLAHLRDVPSLVLGHFMDVLAYNRAAELLFGRPSRAT
jgi:MmyB-like transcription regulator ligand binding domain